MLKRAARAFFLGAVDQTKYVLAGLNIIPVSVFLCRLLWTGFRFDSAGGQNVHPVGFKPRFLPESCRSLGKTGDQTDGGETRTRVFRSGPAFRC